MKKNKKTTFSHTIRQHVTPALLPVIALMALTACNGSGGGDLLAGGGIGGTGISIGTISGFGSIVVNDVDFNTKEAEVVANGESIGTGNSVVESALAVGMVVRVEGTIYDDGTSTAERIVYDDDLRGPVTSIEALDSVAKKLVVLGQIVIVEKRTRLKNTDFDGIAEGHVLQISGWPDAGGVIRATYVAKIIDPPDPGQDEVTIKGIVTEADDRQRWFHINQLVVDLSEIEGAAVPAVGQLVIVNGLIDDEGVLNASEITVEDGPGINDTEYFEIENVVTEVRSPTEFSLGTVAVRTDETTTFIGLQPDDIIPGARLFVSGSLIEGQLLAEEVIAKDKINIEGKVAKVNEGLGEFTLSGLSPLVIRVTGVTKIFGDASQLADIQEGQHVKILGYAAGEDKVEAAQVKVEKRASDRVKLQGPINGKSNTTVSVFNVAIDLSRIDEFETDTAGSVPRDEFLILATEGDTVSANGNLIGDAVEWKGIELLQE